jgi:hypothetical protein
MRFACDDASTLAQDINEKIRLFAKLTGSEPLVTVYGPAFEETKKGGELVFPGSSGLEVVRANSCVITVIADGEPCRVRVPAWHEGKPGQFSFTLEGRP